MDFPRAPWRTQVFLRRRAAAPTLALALTLAAHTVAHSQTAAPAPAAQTLSNAFAAAWQRSPAAQSLNAKRQAAQGTLSAAQSLLAEPPALILSHRTDRLNANQGAREYEAELDLPLWLPGRRAAAGSVAREEGTLVDAAAAAEKLKLAGEVRQAWWDAALAANELAVAKRRVQEAMQLDADVQRRVRAGDLARVDANQAQGALLSAQAAQLAAQTALQSATLALQALTGMPAASAIADEPTRAEAPAATPAPGWEAQHPAVAAGQAASQTAQAKLSLASASNRANPTLGLTFTRDRGAFGETPSNTVRVAVTVPFSSAPLSAAQTETARAELLSTQAQADLARAQVQAQLQAAQDSLQAARQAVQWAQQREALARDTQALIGKSFTLGQSDLTTRLRAESDLFDAQRNLMRARIDQARAISSLNQALGILP